MHTKVNEFEPLYSNLGCDFVKFTYSIWITFIPLIIFSLSLNHWLEMILNLNLKILNPCSEIENATVTTALRIWILKESWALLVVVHRTAIVFKFLSRRYLFFEFYFAISIFMHKKYMKHTIRTKFTVLVYKLHERFRKLLIY